MATVDLLEVAKTLDPRFAQNMPQEVADAFANGEVIRIFRTSKDAPLIKTNNLKATANVHGDYSGSIYVQTKSGKTARWKYPEYAIELDDGTTDAAWNANHGHGAFFDNAMGVDLDNKAVMDQYLLREVANEHLGPAGKQYQALQDVGTRMEELTGDQLAGLHVYEYGSQGHHKGDRIIDVFESSGERHFYQGDIQNNLRGTKSVEQVSDFISRKKGGPAPVVSVPSTPKPTPSNTPVAPVTPTKPKTPAPKPTVNPTPPTNKPVAPLPIKPGKKLPPPGSPGGVVITPIPTPKPAPIPSSKPTKIAPKVTPRRYPKPTPMRYDSDRLNKLRPLPKYKDVLVAGITASPGSSPSAVATAVATTPAGSSIAFRDLVKNKAKAISGSSVIKKYHSISNTKLTMGGIAAAGLATSIAISKNRLSEKEKR